MRIEQNKKNKGRKIFNFASSLGLRQTPSFIIVNSDGSNPELIVGVYPFSVFKEIIDKKMLQQVDKPN